MNFRARNQKYSIKQSKIIHRTRTAMSIILAQASLNLDFTPLSQMLFTITLTLDKIISLPSSLNSLIKMMMQT
jgi:hypothetical protein